MALLMSVAAENFGRMLLCGKTCKYIVPACWLLAFALHAPAVPVMEEGFNYAAGTGLAANSPWSGGIGSSVSVVSGNLTLGNLQGTTPAGNMLRIGGGGSQIVYRNFSDTPITAASGGAVYFSMLINCALLPTNTQIIASLMPAGSSPTPTSADPLDLYVTTGIGGYRFSVRSDGGDRATASKVLSLNTTHLIVVKYVFETLGLVDSASIYIDPTPGDREPAFPDALTGEEDDDGGGADISNLQMMLLRSPSSASQGSFYLDTLRIGTNWADVTPLILPVSVIGPQNEAVCAGSQATFSVTASGMPPFSYQWRTNGIAIPGETNDIYVLLSPSDADALNVYDVVVDDTIGSITSRVASLAISYTAPSISLSPSNQMVLPGTSNATFSVAVSGDAPLSFQWRANGIAIPGTTNTTYTTTNVARADATNAIDLVASNPCGSVTSAPPVGLYFPVPFYAAFDSGAGFFGGENLIITNTSGIAFNVWSSPDPSIPVTKWALEGSMSELPLGTSGLSRYGITLNPVTSPVYYIFAQANTGPYPPTQWVLVLTTPDFASYFVSSVNVGISPDGVLDFPAPPSITQQPQDRTALAGQNLSFTVAATGSGLGYQWITGNTSISGASSPVLGLTNVSAADAGPYAVIITNSLGSVTSSVATLTVALPPALQLEVTGPGIVQWNANSVTGLNYVVESTTNLFNGPWTPVLTNNTGSHGVVSFQLPAAGAPLQFYRLAFP